MRKIIFSLFIVFTLSVNNGWAQLPNCTANPATTIYIQTGTSIYNYDVTLPVSATNPILNTITLPSSPGGLAVSNNLNNPLGPSPTFYTTVGGNYYYYDGATWVNTGHSAGPAPGGYVNPGGGGNYIYNYTGNPGGNISQYDGTGNATLLLNVPGFGTGGPYDIVGDCDGGFYVLRTSTSGGPAFLRKYNSTGGLVSSWTTTGSSGTAGGGFAIVNNTVYYHNGSGFNDAPFTAPSTNLAFTLNPNTIPGPSDMACCRVCANNDPTADFSMTADTLCQGDCISFTDLTTNLPISWSWTFQNGTPSTSTNQNPANVCFNTPGTHTVQLIASNVTGSDTVVKQIYVYSQPDAAIAGKTEICVGESTTLTASPAGIMYLWNTTANTQNITVAPATNTTYEVVVTNGLCTDSAIHTVVVNPLPIVSASATLTRCDANTGTVTAIAGQGTPGYNYTWTGGLNGATITDLGVGPYSVTVTDSKNCTVSTSVVVGMHPNPVAGVTPYPFGEIRIGETIRINASGGIKYEWTPSIYLDCDNCPETNSRPLVEQINYCVNVTDINGCEDTACTTIFVDTSCSYIFIPTAFSPNNDGLNDYISVSNTCDINKLTFSIFNRWGQKVFESNDVRIKWDGTFNGEPQPISTYHYYLQADLINGRRVQQRGDITLIR